jgi:hypothetical protein
MIKSMPSDTAHGQKSESIPTEKESPTSCGCESSKGEQNRRSYVEQLTPAAGHSGDGIPGPGQLASNT